MPRWLRWKRTESVHTWDELTEAAENLLTYGELVLEAFVPFTCEVSVIATKSRHGEIAIFPVVENEHQDSILHRTIVPARVSELVEKKAKQIAMQIVDGLEVVGTLAVEMFVTVENKLVVNELAPRPHNSGHYTIEACKTSQFEQHIRAICGLPLGETTLLTPAVMENLLGEHVAPLMERLNELNSISLHLYGKKEAKWKRKMGHLTVLGEDTTRCLQTLMPFGRKK